IADEGELTSIRLPCIVKPADESGGSSFVFFARTLEDVRVYGSYIAKSGKRPLAQQYLPHDRGEFTVGILSDQDGSVVGSIALNGVSSPTGWLMVKAQDCASPGGISQGQIAGCADVGAPAETIARAVGSRGPLNIQGRMDAAGRFLPFEINPRFSAS